MYRLIRCSGQFREVAGIFMDLPDRKDLPDYYKVIQQPISLREIEVSRVIALGRKCLADKQDRMMHRKYETWEEFFDEAELMCSNAFQYNEDDSEVYADATQIKV